MSLLNLSDDQVTTFLGGKPVLTTGGLPFLLSCLLQINFYFIFQSLAIALKEPWPVFATSVPERVTSITEITSLSLRSSNLTSLPESLGLLLLSLSFLFFPLFSFLIVLLFCLGSFTALVELDISHNPLGDSSVPLLVSIIKASRTLKTLR